MRNHWWRRGRAAVCLALLLALITPAVGRAEAPWPGVPDDTLPKRISCPSDPAGCGLATAWLGTQTRGLSQVAQAEQWAKIPLQAALVQLGTTTTVTYPKNDPEGRRLKRVTYLNAFLSSPNSAQHGYGHSLPFTVRTVAFGTIPVEARVQVAQTRDERNLPIPIHGRFEETVYRGQSRYAPTTLTGRIEVRILGLSVDGVDLQLVGACQSQHPGELVAKTPGGWIPQTPDDRAADSVHKEFSDSLAREGKFSPGGGGVLNGTVEVPPFTGCRTAHGDDLSALVTAAVSGPGNALTLTTPDLARDGCWTIVPPLGFKKPRGPFQGDPRVNCDRILTPYDFPLPRRH